MIDNDALEQLCSKIGAALQQKQFRLVTAESCTGGSIASSITDVAGSSQWFECGYVTYSNQAKIDLLGVDATILEQYGAVSEQTAMAMAEGALQYTKANVAIATTGIAGPGGGTDKKPVGTVCFAWAFDNEATATITQHFVGDRIAVRKQAVLYSLQELLARLPP